MHQCIVFDEISSQQVLANKLVFQAGPDEITLSQSACNAHSYKIYLHGVPIILCSNDFRMESRPDAPLKDVDIDWLRANIIDASLAPGEVWWEPAASESGFADMSLNVAFAERYFDGDPFDLWDDGGGMGGFCDKAA